MLPEPVDRLVQHLARLPGIGRRTASRLALHILSQDRSLAVDLARALLEVSEKVGPCRVCGNLSTGELCDVCQDPERDEATVCVVEGPAQIVAIERSHAFGGRYHVLGGLISPLAGIGPGDLRIQSLMERLQRGVVRELVFALSPTVDGETTALYIHQRIQRLDLGVRCTRLAQGIPLGGEIQHADETTLARAFEDRRELT